MQRLFEHIENFSKLLNAKGYDGNFHSPYGFYDKVRENLTKHVFQCYEEQKRMAQVHLATYTHWKDNESPYIRCNFQTSYSPNEGFQVMKLNIEYGNQYGPLRHKDISITDNQQIPSRVEANKMMMEQRMAKSI